MFGLQKSRQMATGYFKNLVKWKQDILKFRHMATRFYVKSRQMATRFYVKNLVKWRQDFKNLVKWQRDITKRT